jgi:hypothetical protein
MKSVRDYIIIANFEGAGYLQDPIIIANLEDAGYPKDPSLPASILPSLPHFLLRHLLHPS